MTWWCSATNAPWDWTWRAYPGVWLFVLALVGGYIALRRATGKAGNAAGAATWRAVHTAAFTAGAICVWLALDWPVGALGAGYLASVHTVQYLLLGLIAPALLLLGVPGDAWRRLVEGRPAIRGLLRGAAQPLAALVVFNAIVVVTHIPGVVDGLMRKQLGSFAIDLAWLVGGLVLWWAAIAPPGLDRMARPVKMAYLFASTIIPTVPAAFLTFADYPIYSLYELAPRVAGIDARADQQVAGLFMKLIGDPIIWIAIAVIFFRWSAEQAAPDRPAAPAVPPSRSA